MRLYIIHYIRINRVYLFDWLTHLPNNKFLLSPHEQIDSNPFEDKNIPTSSISTQPHLADIKSSGKISEISHFEFRGFDFGFRFVTKVEVDHGPSVEREDRVFPEYFYYRDPIWIGRRTHPCTDPNLQPESNSRQRCNKSPRVDSIVDLS